VAISKNMSSLYLFSKFDLLHTTVHILLHHPAIKIFLLSLCRTRWSVLIWVAWEWSTKNGYVQIFAVGKYSWWMTVSFISISYIYLSVYLTRPCISLMLTDNGRRKPYVTEYLGPSPPWGVCQLMSWLGSLISHVLQWMQLWKDGVSQRLSSKMNERVRKWLTSAN